MIIRNARHAFIALILLVATATSPVAAQALDAACPDDVVALSASSRIESGLPGGIDLEVLAAAELPPQPWHADSLVLSLRAIEFDGWAATGERTHGIPFLYYVLQGKVSFYLGPENTREPQVVMQGGSIFVERNVERWMSNGSPEPAVLLRIALATPDSETTVSRGDLPTTEGSEFPAQDQPPTVTSHLLFQGGVPVDDGYSRLFIGCLTWSDPDASLGPLVNSGPFGLFVASGSIQTGESGRGLLDMESCAFYQTGSRPYFQVGDDSPSALIAGVLPSETDWWVDDAEDQGSREFRCEEDT